MNFQQFASSEQFFTCREPLAEPGLADFGSLRGRGKALIGFFKQIFTIPLAGIAKLCRTFLSILGLGFAAFLLIATLFLDRGIREFFLKKVTRLAQELADWVLWPVAIVLCLGRLLLAATIHPALYFGV